MDKTKIKIHQTNTKRISLEELRNPTNETLGKLKNATPKELIKLIFGVLKRLKDKNNSIFDIIFYNKILGNIYSASNQLKNGAVRYYEKTLSLINYNLKKYKDKIADLRDIEKIKSDLDFNKKLRYDIGNKSISRNLSKNIEKFQEEFNLSNLLNQQKIIKKQLIKAKEYLLQKAIGQSEVDYTAGNYKSSVSGLLNTLKTCSLSENVKITVNENLLRSYKALIQSYVNKKEINDIECIQNNNDTQKFKKVFEESCFFEKIMKKNKITNKELSNEIDKTKDIITLLLKTKYYKYTIKDINKNKSIKGAKKTFNKIEKFCTDLLKNKKTNNTKNEEKAMNSLKRLVNKFAKLLDSIPNKCEEKGRKHLKRKNTNFVIEKKSHWGKRILKLPIKLKCKNNYEKIDSIKSVHNNTSDVLNESSIGNFAKKENEKKKNEKKKTQKPVVQNLGYRRKCYESKIEIGIISNIGY